jgi:hypothetical protein
MSYDILCPKCHRSERLKIDERGPYYCGFCDWERGIKPVVREVPKPKRNTRCPCGSGLKYKRCCGK